MHAIGLTHIQTLLLSIMSMSASTSVSRDKCIAVIAMIAAHTAVNAVLRSSPCLIMHAHMRSFGRQCNSVSISPPLVWMHLTATVSPTAKSTDSVISLLVQLGPPKLVATNWAEIELLRHCFTDTWDNAVQAGLKAQRAYCRGLQRSADHKATAIMTA